MELFHQEACFVSTTDATPSPTPARRPRRRSTLNYYVARTLDDVLEAWQLVYMAYRRAELIDSNPFELHAIPQAVGPQTVVITGCLGPMPGTTLSAYIDNPLGLPLDSVYPEELGALRKQGRRLMEVGLFGDRRDHLVRSSEGLFDLMRFAFYYGIHSNCDDAVIGIHPRHAPFYQRFFALEAIGEARSYPTVKNNPVVLLRLNFRAKRDSLPKGLAFFSDNQIAEGIFANRYLFDQESVAGSMLERYLAYKQKTAKAA
jgi:hypothetical protein